MKIINFYSTFLLILLCVAGSRFAHAQTYCASGGSGGQDIVNVQIGTINNSSTCNQTAGAGSVPGSYSNYVDLAAPDLMQFKTVPFSIGVAYCTGFQSVTTSIWIDFNHDGSFGEGELAYRSGSVFEPNHTVTGTITIPGGALLGPTRMRVITAATGFADPCGSYNGGETEDYTVTIVSPPFCNGAPAPGNTLASQTTTCLNGTIDLSFSSSSALNSGDAVGFTYQWFNNAGPIAGATNPTYTATITTADNFYCQVTCSQSGQTGQSAPIAISLTPFYACYCASAATNTTGADIFNVTAGTLNNTSDLSQTGGPGSILNRYSNYTTLVAAPVFNQQATIPFSIQVSGNSGNASTSIWIDYNQNGIFENPAERVYQTSQPNSGNHTVSGSFTIPLSAATGVTGMRVVTNAGQNPVGSACDNYGEGETEDYVVNIGEVPACSGDPIQTKTIATQLPVCPEARYTFSLTPAIITVGNTYQWYNDGGLIAGATEETYTATITSADNFYCEVTCSNGSKTTRSIPVSVLTCYCTSTALSGPTLDVTNVTAGTLNHSTSFSQTGGPGSALGAYSDFTTVVDAPVFNQLATIPFSVSAGGTASYFYIAIWIDYNRNGTFESPGEFIHQVRGFQNLTTTGSFIIPKTASTGITRMRVITSIGLNPLNSACENYGQGETEDYLINIAPPPACSDSPLQLNAIATQNPVCPEVSFTFSLSPTILTSNNTYQWYNNAGPIAGATNETYTATITGPDNFYCEVTCPTGQNTTISTPVAVHGTFLYCPCTSASDNNSGSDIFNVSIAEINNSSDCGQTGGPGSIHNRYSDYTRLVAAPNLTIANAIPISVRTAACNSFGLSSTSVWIDYNHNGSFDAPGERVFFSSNNFSPDYTLTGSISIPETALPGLTRMRVISGNGGVGESACGGYSSGETEDYFVNIVVPICDGNVSLPTSATTNTQNVATKPLVSNGCEYVAKVVPTEGFTDATIKSWLETIPPFNYVPRHYEITPATNANTATGTVTLYFSQADFNAYNATISSGLLPTGPNDVSGIPNFQIIKFSGTSPTGLNYPGQPASIPSEENSWNTGDYTFVWNSINSIWEVTFPVSGFSGFIAKSNAQPLPVTLISFTGKVVEKSNELNWKTSSEVNFSHFEIQRSLNAKTFEKIGELASDEQRIYTFLDPNTPRGKAYYRLKMIDLDTKYSYSKMIAIGGDSEKSVVGNFYPNPSNGKVYIEINALKKGTWHITHYNVAGRVLSHKVKILQAGLNIIAIDKLSTGVNILKFDNGSISETRKVVRD
ncbi:GEVED domain-containing protein [Dyadobacter psychrophilus]|uniref:Por secretion system C-terminal sorting domain-containing protein n=1 Tax=Dyadobacter psychrophilus TaxID=651661 RepID=A0A1T5BSQ4_9BACT|nr:GEVED domain-containing protein [Dyadobacter psychrophilus]SKB50169.1 Por secretion system C-terminal sorting domain-containing protein [Dyadobacter psychrophilus]